LIPGFAHVKAAAHDAGALGCTISGAGPTIVAVVKERQHGNKVGAAMAQAFQHHGGLEVNSVQVVELDRVGAREVD
jgi:homoserine kinase